MLPLIKLNAGDLFSLDAFPEAASLMPEDASALDGEFAGVLRANVAPLLLPHADTGTVLPDTGNALPLAPLLPDSELALSVNPEDLPVVEFTTLDLETGEDAAVDNALAQMLAGSVGSEGSSVDADLPPVTGLPVKDLEAQHTPPLPAPVSEELTRTEPVDRILPGDSLQGVRQHMQDSNGLNHSPFIGAPATAGNVQRAEPLETDARSGERRPLINAAQQANLPQALTATTDDAPAPVVQTGINVRPQVATDSGRSSRERIITAPETSTPGLTTERPTTASGESPLTLRPVTMNVSPIPVPSDTQQMPVDTSARFGSELTAALSRQPQTTALPTSSQTIDLPVQQQGWDNSLAERVTLMANAKLQNAEIRLTPAELGPLKIRLVVEDGTANVTFHSQHLTTRDAIEQALPRLREMLAENGLSLGQANVNDEGMDQRERNAQSGGRANAEAGDEQTHADDASPSRPDSRRLDSLVDTFA